MVTDYTAIPELTDHGLGGPAEVAARAAAEQAVAIARFGP